jgi:uncharacterized protein (DUF433 family)
MDTTSTAYKHIGLDESGTARIAGTRSRVIDVAMDRAEFGYSPEEICRQHPHLTLGQLHSALAYYFDHKQELDAEIERRKDEADALRRELEDPDLQKRLREEAEEHRPSASPSDE